MLSFEHLLLPAELSAIGLSVVALILSLIGKKYSGKRPDVIVSGILSIAAIVLYSFILYRIDAMLTLGLLPGFPLRIGCDHLSFLVILNIGIVGSLALIASYDYLDIYSEKGYIPYYFCTLVFIYSMMLLILVRDWLWFLFFFEIMTLSSYFLIGYEYYEEEPRTTAWKYFITMHILCSTPLILGVSLIYATTGGNLSFNASITRFSFLVAALFLFGFATKSGLFPFHFWLPDAHPVAPSPISALLSGCMVEIGVYGYYRLMLQLGELNGYVYQSLLAMAFLSTLVGVASYIRQRDIKRLFAWSTIDNIGWMYLLLAVMGKQAAWLLGLYILLHGLAKSAAFIGSGGVLYTFGTKDISNLRGTYHSNRLVVGSLIASIFALEGVPPFGFFWSRLILLGVCFVFNPTISIVYALLWCIAFVVFLKNIHVLLSSENHVGVKPIRSTPSFTTLSVIILLCLSIIIPLLIIKI